MWPYALTILLSAFLLFQVQPMIAKMILPWFGGSAAVWATCLVFFQTVLLLGYLYSHALTTRLPARLQRIAHSVLLLASLASLPILPNPSWKPLTPDDPALRILGLLALTVGLPYFLLSTTGPLIQAWFVQARPGQSPYRLFALSNFGSMVALLSYPVAIEPALTLRQQAWSWSGAFAAFVAACAATAWLSLKNAAPAAPAPPALAGDRPLWRDYAGWILFACCPSILLLAFTAHVSMDLAPIPFFWILPLALYLLSFILCFDAEGWYRRIVYLPLSALALGATLWLFQSDHGSRPDVRICIAIYMASFFICAMVCHGELSRRRPHPSRLTSYYLMISVGGALGGVFVALVAPAVFNAYYEFPLSLAFCGLLVTWAAFRVPEWPFRQDALSWKSILLFAACAGMLGSAARVMREEIRGSLFVARNFYGEMRVRQYDGVYDWSGYRTLVHGSINHGEQYTHPARRRTAASYYCKETGLGRYMESRIVGNPQRVAVIGLGTGTIAAYARPGDLIRFYEINPIVEKIAHEQFTYIKDAEGPIEVQLGDARLSLERQPPQGFDLIVLDAFSSDSIPMHLLTTEAMAQYFRHLKPDGVLAVHVSNRYISLEPVLERAALHARKAVRVVETDDNEDESCYATTWVLLTAREALFDLPEFRSSSVKPAKPAPWLRTWTDDFSNLYRLLK